MKELIKHIRITAIVAVTALSLMAFQCNEVEPPRNRCTWRVVNHSGEDVVFHSDLTGAEWLQYQDTVIVFGPIDLYDDGYFFDEMLSVSLKHDDDPKVSVEFDNVMAKEWRLWSKEQPGRQYFKERSWAKVVRDEESTGYSYCEWTFELLPEDIDIPE